MASCSESLVKPVNLKYSIICCFQAFRVAKLPFHFGTTKSFGLNFGLDSDLGKLGLPSSALATKLLRF